VLTVTEATEALQNAMPDFPSDTVALRDVCGRILHEPASAERDQPPFDRVTMDGIAIRHSRFAGGQKTFPLQGRQHAGDPPLELSDESSCIEVMTGAVLPGGTDCVIPVERIEVTGSIATLENAYVPEYRQFIHAQGSDHARGHRLLNVGHRIEPVDVAVIASCGLMSVRVSRQPVIRIISTGNELVPAGQPIANHQIRMSNGPALMALITAHGYGNCEHDHLVDDRAVLHARLEEHLRQSQVLILSGGVSMGKADFVPDVLSELGVKVVFHKISQRPGKPMWFGIGANDQAVFALPGNPVSTLICARQYVLPALSKASGAIPSAALRASLTESLQFTAALTCFQPVRVRSADDGTLLATPVATNTSGDFSALSRTDGYLELPMEQSEFVAGSSRPLRLWTDHRHAT